MACEGLYDYPSKPPTWVVFTCWSYIDVTFVVIKWINICQCDPAIYKHSSLSSLCSSRSLLPDFCASACITDCHPGSFSNSTGVLHHNRSPAVIVDFLPVTAVGREEGFLSDTPSLPRSSEARAKGNSVVEPVNISSRR